MVTLKIFALASLTSTLAGAVQIIDSDTALPLGLICGGMVLTVTITWKVATAVTNVRRDVKDLKKDHKTRRRHSGSAEGAGGEDEEAD